MITEHTETKGIPIDEVRLMSDFSFFCSYSGLNDWDVSVHNFVKMFNREMDRDATAELATGNTLVMWKYADAPIVMWGATSAADHYTFFAYAPYEKGVYDPGSSTGNGITVTSLETTPGKPVLSYTVPSKVENQPDLMFAEPVYDLVPTGHPVRLLMRHALTSVGFRVAGGLSEKITGLSVTGVYVSGYAEVDGSDIDWTLTGSKVTTDYSASLNFDPGQSYYTVTGTMTNPLQADGWLMMLPQELDQEAKVKISLSDGTSREINLKIDNTTTWEWKAGKTVIYEILVTPAGSTMVIPNHIVLPYPGQNPATQTLEVVCLDFNGNPDPTETWTLSIPEISPSVPVATWLRLGLSTSGPYLYSVSGTGSQTVYLSVGSNFGSTAPPRSVNLTLDGGATIASTVVQESFPGPNFSGWIYVKKGATGTGLSWNNALPSIKDGLSIASLLRLEGIPVHGVLVAGGSSRIYDEVVASTDRIFGGWEGLAGTELVDPNDPGAPYTSVFRDLANYKAVVSQNVVVAGAGAVLDGIAIKGFIGSANPLIINDGAYANAVEVVDNKTTSTIATMACMNNSMAVNMLIANNNNGVVIASGSLLLNSTVVGNLNESYSQAKSEFNASTIINCVYWNNVSSSFVNGATASNCAFPTGEVPVGTGNVALDPASNTAWFTSVVVAPGPHFNLTSDQTKAPYMALNNRAPMLGRGDESLFNSNTLFMPSGFKRDINGKPRHIMGTDMGCYEDQVLEGFKLRWASDRVYISSKNGTVNQIPLILPDNIGNQIGVQWSIPALSPPLSYSTFSGPFSGQGDGVVVGIVTITTNGNYTSGGERYCGSFVIHTNLGGYLADAQIEVWQIPGTSALWEDGYIGSFHRNNETSERYITGENSYSSSSTGTKGYYSYWTARIVSGLDWIKIDTNPKGYNGGEVIETFGGVVTGHTPNSGDAIRFRVGMKSTLPAGAPPRYGLIVVSRGNNLSSLSGATWFFVRQGEEADYVYRPTNVSGVTGDNKTSVSPNTRLEAKKVSPYNIIAPDSYTMLNQTTSGATALSQHGASTVNYPTLVGDYFQRNRMVPYRRGVQTSALPNSSETSYSATREVCPPGYRHPTFRELKESLYLNLAANDALVSGGDGETMRGFMWGYYADGFFDRHAPDPVPTINPGNIFVVPSSVSSNNRLSPGNVFPAQPGNAALVAAKGMLMVNHANFASCFFPMSGSMSDSAPNEPIPTATVSGWQNYAIANPNIDGVIVFSLYSGQRGMTGLYPTTYWTGANSGGNTHWVSGHVGLACTSISNYFATNVRCVKDE